MRSRDQPTILGPVLDDRRQLLQVAPGWRVGELVAGKAGGGEGGRHSRPRREAPWVMLAAA
jgi:hypothetical protein